MGKKALITGTIVLTATSFITRILGFIFRIYMSNIMGAEGLGLYQLIFPIYMLIWSLCSAGISLAVSKMVAEHTAKKQHSDASRVLKSSIAVALSLGMCLSVFLFITAPWVATHFIHDAHTLLSLRDLCFCIPFMCTACCIRGYFQGRQEMAVSGIAQVVEQIARMCVIYLFASFYIPKGLSYVCALGTLGLCAGEVMSCLFTLTMFKLKQRQLPYKRPTLPYLTTMQTLIAIAIPITANRFLMSALSSIENILIPIQLQKFGLTGSEALGMYGMFSGMALPLLFFPSMVTMSISTALVPAISEAVATQNTRILHRTVSKSIQFSALIGIGASSLFFTLGDEIAMACYHLPEVGEMLRLLAVICPFLYLQNILTGMLNGLGLQRLTFKGNMIASLLCIGTILLFVPQRGIMGFILAMLFQSSFATIYHLFHVLKHIHLRVDVTGWFIRPILAACPGCLLMKAIYTHYLSQCLPLALSTLLAISILGLFYVAFLFCFRSLTWDDVKLFF